MYLIRFKINLAQTYLHLKYIEFSENVHNKKAAVYFIDLQR